MKSSVEISINWLVIIILIVLSLILAIIFLGVFFKATPFASTAKEICLLTIAKVFGKAELCEVFI
jgi:hypothetical protein